MTHTVISYHTQHYSSYFFFFNDTATTEIYTLSLHDALPISTACGKEIDFVLGVEAGVTTLCPCSRAISQYGRSEEHTSELQSHVNLVCRLLLEKKKEEERAGSLREGRAGMAWYTQRSLFFCG